MQEIKIAIVDDCLAVRDFFRFALESFDTSVPLEIDTYDRLERPEELLRYAVVFLDEVMPEQTGTDVVRSMLEQVDWDYDKLPCVFFVTGFPKEIMEKKLACAHIDRSKLNYVVLEKPTTIEELRDSLARVCPIVFGAATTDLHTPSLGEALKSSVCTILGKKKCFDISGATRAAASIMLMLLCACSTAVQVGSIVPGLYSLDQHIESMVDITERNRGLLSDEELQILRSAYSDWQDIKALLESRGCTLKAGQSICTLDVETIKLLHAMAKSAYRKVYEIALRHLDEMDIYDRVQVMDFHRMAKELDAAVTEFENSPDADRAMEVIQALSMLASVAVKVLPLIIGAI